MSGGPADPGADWLADIAHGLQSPLVAVRGYCEMVAQERLGPVTAEQRAALEAALRNVERMVALVRGVLELARRAGAPVVAEECVAMDAAEVARRVLLDHAGEAAARGVTLAVEPAGPGPAVRAMPDAVALVLDNLVGNAIKFNRPGGRVDVRAANVPGAVVLEVRDTGQGIPADEQARVFERLFRGRAAARIPGTGLGLALVRDVVTRHGGAVELDSRPGEGTTVRVTFPR